MGAQHPLPVRLGVQAEHLRVAAPRASAAVDARQRRVRWRAWCVQGVGAAAALRGGHGCRHAGRARPACSCESPPATGRRHGARPGAWVLAIAVPVVGACAPWEISPDATATTSLLDSEPRQLVICEPEGLINFAPRSGGKAGDCGDGWWGVRQTGAPVGRSDNAPRGAAGGAGRSRRRRGGARCD